MQGVLQKIAHANDVCKDTSFLQKIKYALLENILDPAKGFDEVEVLVLKVIQRHGRLILEHGLDIKLSKYRIAFAYKIGRNIAFCVQQ